MIEEQIQTFRLTNGHRLVVEVTVDGPLAVTGYRLRITSLSPGESSLLVMPRASNAIELSTVGAMLAEQVAIDAAYAPPLYPPVEPPSRADIEAKIAFEREHGPSIP